MIDQSEPATSAGTIREAGAARPPAPPVPAPVGRALLLLAVFVCAACGLVYELVLVALGSYLVGDSVTQASIVLSVMVFAMGVGSLLAKRWRWQAAAGFALVEVLLALVGGLSAFALYGCFAWFGQSKEALVAFSFGIGVLIGCEIPLLMVLTQRIRQQDAAGAVADLFAADYVGALVGGLAFPFLLLPALGQLEAALLTGAVNVVAGGVVVLWLFRADLTPGGRAALYAANAAVLVVLAVAALCAQRFEAAARHAIYGAEVRIAEHTAVQEIVLTGRRSDSMAMFLDGRLRVSGRDEHHYHEALVHPAMAGPHRSVLILGGADGLALREVLRYRDVRRVTLVDIDPGLLRLARTDPGLTSLNDRAHDDPRARAISADAFDWLRARARKGGEYDVVLADLPPPRITQCAKLYSQEFYMLVRRALAERGRLVVHAGSPHVRPRLYRTVEVTVRAAGLRTTAYQVGDPHAWFREGSDRMSGYGGVRTTTWGFVLASTGRAPVLRLPDEVPPLESLTEAGLQPVRPAGWERDVARQRPSTLVHPRYFG